MTKTFKLGSEVAAALARAAEASGRPESELIREGLEHVLGLAQGLDMVALLGADVGSGRGPGDLSGNRARMSGYGRSRPR